MNDVLFALGLKKNILLVSSMLDVRCVAKFDSHKAIIRDQTHVIEKGVLVGGISKLQANIVKHGAPVHGGINLREFYHKKFGHLQYGALPLLKNLVQGLSSFKIEKECVCKGCPLGKHVKDAFPSSEHGSRGILNIIHSHVIGSMSSISLTSSVYHISFICKT